VEIVILMGFLWLVGMVLMVIYQIFAPILVEIAAALHRLILRWLGRDPGDR
jgi:hypothetical protein